MVEPNNVYAFSCTFKWKSDPAGDIYWDNGQARTSLVNESNVDVSGLFVFKVKNTGLGLEFPISTTSCKFVYCNHKVTCTCKYKAKPV